ncbi:MAG: methyl-accepting chemotaxis protein, partial [Silicimonas sp.]|nr:methyl-accepting chemotaxis protein [Silicimonas sp.]
RLEEIQGQHHRMFCDPAYANSPEYKAFWEQLGRGEFASGEFKRFTKTGDGIWIQASYNPIFDPEGRPYKVVKYATDITEAKLKSADYEGQINAVSRSQAVIEFDLDGTIRTANENFLATTGYRLEEIQGQHHRMFCEGDYASSAEYSTFWEDLARGEFASGEYRRLAKNGATVWIQASYNPIFDPEGKPYKVVKYATDITAWKTELLLIIDSLIALSKGDLTLRLPSEGSHDLEDMRAAFNTTLDKLGELVDDINFASAAIQEESESIADSAQSLSSRCERQAATVEETSASMEEMASTVKSNAKNAENATAAAKNATEHAENGGGIVQEAIAAMVKIEEGSAEVRKIIEVIDAIAFQTNLLALNAGVEAARAGEAGSGFAVVASEVRALAQRASESARDISKLIESSERQVEEGADLVKKTGEALTEIVSSVTMVSTGIDEIYTASSEQATGVNEINHAMTDIDSTTQKTAAISEESTAAAASLAQRSNALRDLVGFFKTGSKPRDPGRARTEAPAAASAPAEEATPAAPPVTGQLALAAADEPEDWREF